MNHYFVAYDICCPKRRRKLLKVLEDFAYRLQYSVLIYELGALTVKNRMIYGLKYKETEACNDKYRIL